MQLSPSMAPGRMIENHESSSGRVLIVEPNTHGHRLYYVSILVRELKRLGAQVHILSHPAARESVEWRIHMGDNPDVIFHAESSAINVHDIEALSMRVGSTRVVIPDGDQYLAELALRGWSGSGSVSVLIMRPDAQGRRTPRSVAWGISKKVLIAVADRRKDTRVVALRSATSRRYFPIRWVADPITLACTAADLSNARAMLETPQQLYWVGVFGAISPRKNVDLIAEAVRAVPGVALLLAGEIDDDARAGAESALKALQDDGRTVLVIRENLSDPAFDALISNVDCVAAAHSNEGPSGVVGKAIAARRALLLAGARSLRRDARNIGDGAMWSPLDPRKMATNLKALKVGSLRSPGVAMTASEFARRLL